MALSINNHAYLLSVCNNPSEVRQAIKNVVTIPYTSDSIFSRADKYQLLASSSILTG